MKWKPGLDSVSPKMLLKVFVLLTLAEIILRKAMPDCDIKFATDIR